MREAILAALAEQIAATLLRHNAPPGAANMPRLYPHQRERVRAVAHHALAAIPRAAGLDMAALVAAAARLEAGSEADRRVAALLRAMVIHG